MLMPGGRLVYSTCTFAKEENEDVVSHFLANHKDFMLMKIGHEKYGLSVGLDADGKTARIWPHKQGGEGHFIALLAKDTCADPPPLPSLPTAPIVKTHPFIRFAEKYLRQLPVGDILQHKDRLYMPPGGCPALRGLKISRAGLFLGDLKKDRFEPSYAFAMAYPELFLQTVNCDLEDFRITKFLGGESFEIQAQDGYNLFCIEGFPIGLSKILHGRLKGRKL